MFELIYYSGVTSYPGKEGFAGIGVKQYISRKFRSIKSLTQWKRRYLNKYTRLREDRKEFIIKKNGNFIFIFDNNIIPESWINMKVQELQKYCSFFEVPHIILNK